MIMISDVYNKIRKEIKLRRNSAGMYQRELADAMNMSTDMIVKVENDMRNPSLQFIIKFCEVMEISLQTFFRFRHYEEMSKLDKHIIKELEEENDE